MRVSNILVTGGAGYIGSLLVRKLINKGYRVKILDNFIYDNYYTIEDLEGASNVEIVRGDVGDQRLVSRIVRGVDAVVHLAAIVGEPACSVNSERAVRVNYIATVNLAKASLEAGVKKFIFASTCSVYGAGDEFLNESSEIKPIGLYAETKSRAEESLKLIFKGFDNYSELTILRFATLFGLSVRMRFDLVVNFFTLKAFLEKRLSVFGGDQWRPFLHVDDAAESILFMLEREQGERIDVYNVGSNDLNLRIIDLAEIVSEEIDGVEIDIVREIKDARNYKIRFDKIMGLGYRVKKGIRDGIREIINYLEENKDIDPFDKKFFNYRPF